MNIGIPAWGVFKATMRAIDVMPGTFANSTNEGELEFADRASCF
jgi:hypothetical protein